MPDLPCVQTVIEGRIKGNQIEDSVEQKFSLSMGVDVAVLGAFKANAGFDYDQEWKIEVKFYDKNEM